MRFLFIHQNFPGQFKFLAPALVDQGHDVIAVRMSPKPSFEWNKVRVFTYMPNRGSTKNIHPWAQDFETKVIRAQAILQAFIKLKDEGFTPEIVIAHPGWGESLFVKDVWPDVRLGIYCEFFYNAFGADMNFDPEFSNDSLETQCKLKIKNINNTLHFDLADSALCPTQWQADSFPLPFRSKINVIHEGIDTSILKPLRSSFITLDDRLRLDENSEVITFVNRNLEPYRGFHIFMRSLPKLLKLRPEAHVLIVGGVEAGYGPVPKNGTWKDQFGQEIYNLMSKSEWERVHFLGKIPYTTYINLLQISSAHVYLTYPFVLSWSMLEAMSITCPIVASNTQPVSEVIVDRENGLLVDFFDQDHLVDSICELITDRKLASDLGNNARKLIIDKYELNKCLANQINWAVNI